MLATSSISPSLTDIEENTVSTDETQDMVQDSTQIETIKPTGNISRRRSQVLLERFLKTTPESVASNQEYRRSSSAYTNGSGEKVKHSFKMSKMFPFLSMARRVTSPALVDLEKIDTEQSKIKSILKHSEQNSSHPHSLDKAYSNHSNIQRCESYPESKLPNSDTKANDSSTSVISSCPLLSPTLNSSPSIRHVTFNEEISRNSYEPATPILEARKLSLRQQKQLEKFQRKEMLSLRLMNTKESSSFKENRSDLQEIQNLKMEQFLL